MILFVKWSAGFFITLTFIFVSVFRIEIILMSNQLVTNLEWLSYVYGNRDSPDR